MWEWLKARLRGFRTVVVFSIIGLVGLLDQLQAIDLHTLLQPVFGDRTGAVVGGMAILGILLRAITSTPLFAREMQ